MDTTEGTVDAGFASRLEAEMFLIGAGADMPKLTFLRMCATHIVNELVAPATRRPLYPPSLRNLIVPAS